MKRSICNADGVAIELGAELGRGGEGAVFDLPQHPELVAKLYHAPPAAAKQSKLRLMADSIDSPLREYAAWPEETLHDGAKGPVIGFTMQRIERRLPIHMLYSPAQRRESFPRARFDFLVFVARNIAAAFETLHAHGHVLGDVNQGNVLVGEDSRVILIDCDSFQIEVGDALHRCEVGVAHFTPPELQSANSFVDVTRTPNHDRFGLALLVFHLLMGGRHPYSGVPLADKVGESLEADIRDFRYAYARDAAHRLIAPPPKSVPIAALPPAIVALFEQAFGEGGARSRPTAPQWVEALDALRDQLASCTRQPLHVHATHVGECPWCALDRRHVTLFGQLSRPVAKAEAVEMPGLDLDVMEAEFGRMKLPEPVDMPQFVIPTKMPGADSDLPSIAKILPVIAFVAAIVGKNYMPIGLTMTLFFVGFVGLVVMRNASGGKMAEADFRYAKQRFDKLEQHLRLTIDAINASNGSRRVTQWRDAVQELREHRVGAPGADLSLATSAPDQGLRRFLGSQRIAHWLDARVSRMQRVVLDASGIETAADFDPGSLVQMGMLDPAARAALLQWRSDLILSYRRRASAPQTAAERELAQRWRTRQGTLESEVRSAFAKLKQIEPRQVALPADRIRELQALKTDVAKAHVRWLEAAKYLQ